MKDRIQIKDLHDYLDQEVTLAGWVHIRRDHGKLIFLDLRDSSGLIQMVALPNQTEAHQIASELRSEWVVKVKGKVNKRPDKMVNADEVNGDIEIEILNLEVLNEAETPPFDITTDGREIGEEHRLTYRYLDIRRLRMQRNLRERDKLITFFRNYMHQYGFVEVETPMLMKGTPEGSREYIVPSRLELGKFYALPQAPQQFKQLLMVGGVEKYFQIARCMRDEDLRGDRQPEFTQLDFEMSFVDQEDILVFTEEMFIKLVETNFPNKKITTKPFPRIAYKEAMEKYGSDKPDLRQNKNDPDELAFCWIIDFPMFEKTESGELQAVHHPFCAIKTDDRDKFMSGEDIFSIRASAYDIVLNGYELSSGSIRIHKKSEQEQIFKLLGISPEEQQERFGHILEAFTYGAPPHGGFAPGIDRIAMILLDEPNIREVIAFPKNGEARDLMMKAPYQIPKRQLEELGLEIKTKPKDQG